MDNAETVRNVRFKSLIVAFTVAAFGATGFFLMVYYPKSIQPAAVSSCYANLKQLDGAINTWAFENKKTTNDAPAENELIGENGYIRKWPKCPRGGHYTLGKVGDKPRCSIHEHDLDNALVEVVDPAGRPIPGAAVNIETLPAETSEFGFAFADTNCPFPKWIVISKPGHTTKRVELPVQKWPVRVVLEPKTR